MAQGKRVYTTGPEKRVYTTELQTPEKEKKEGFHGLVAFWPAILRFAAAWRP